MAKANPLRFSTKYQDDETDLLYYGYRYYNAGTGTWLSRDPMGESAGANVHGFVKNAPSSGIDPLGLIPDVPGIPRPLPAPPPPTPEPNPLEPEIKQPQTPDGHMDGTCGGSYGKILWHVPPHSTGWVVQHMRVVAHVTDCQGKPVPNPKNPDKEYTEAWQVVDGTVYPGFLTPGSLPSFGDTWNTADEGDDRKGVITLIGVAKFIAGYPLTVPPWTTEFPNPTGLLPYIKPTPPGWTDKGGRQHSVEITFHCCCRYLKPRIRETIL